MGSGDGGNNHGHVHHITYRNMHLNGTHLGFFLKTGTNQVPHERARTQPLHSLRPDLEHCLNTERP